MMKPFIAAIKTLFKNLQAAFKLWFGLRLLLTTRISSSADYDKQYDLGYWIMLRFKLITLCQWLFCNHRLFAKAEANNKVAALERLKRQVGEGSPDYLSVDVVSPDIDPQEFRETYVKNPKPVIIRGLAKDCAAIAKWNRDFFSKNYGNTQVHLNELRYGSKIEVSEWMGELSEALEDNGIHADLCRILFTQHPELEQDIAPIATWKKFLGRAIYIFPQLFLGYRSGSPLHCAHAWNFFVMIEGRKQWTFINPEHSLQVGALLNPTGLYADACVTGQGNTPNDREELYTHYCPKYRGVLEPGDILLNPPWWWHEVKNLNPFTIGVSSRWFVLNHCATNLLFDFVHLISPQVWQVNYKGILALEKGRNDIEEEDFVRSMISDKAFHARYRRDYEYRCTNKLAVN